LREELRPKLFKRRIRFAPAIARLAGTAALEPTLAESRRQMPGTLDRRSSLLLDDAQRLRLFRIVE
jgi:hypothetical protein